MAFYPYPKGLKRKVFRAYFKSRKDTLTAAKRVAGIAFLCFICPQLFGKFVLLWKPFVCLLQHSI